MHFANSGEEALDNLAAGIEPPPIVILSDINMPVMDGLELLRKIETRRPDLTVMMVTAYGDDERQRLAGEYGAAEFITKPVDFDFLKTRASRSVRRRRLTNPNAAPNGRFQTIPGALVKVGFGARPWKNASAEDGGSTSIVQVMAGAALIQDLRPGLLAVAVQHR